MKTPKTGTRRSDPSKPSGGRRDDREPRETKGNREKRFLERVLARIDELRMAGDPEYAARLLERVLVRFPFLPELYYALACCEMDLGIFTSGLRNFLTASHFDPENPDIRIGVANAFLMLRDGDRALVLIKEILKKHDTHFGARLLYGQFHEERGEWNRSLAEYRQIEDQQTHPTYPLLVERLGICYLNMDKAVRAIEYFDEALRLEPENTEALFHRGIAHGSMQEFSKALDDFEAVIKLDPWDAEALAYAALYQFYLGNRAPAIARVEKAAEMHPGNPLILDIREEIFNTTPPSAQHSAGDDDEEEE